MFYKDDTSTCKIKHADCSLQLVLLGRVTHYLSCDILDTKIKDCNRKDDLLLNKLQMCKVISKTEKMFLKNT